MAAHDSDEYEVDLDAFQDPFNQHAAAEVLKFVTGSPATARAGGSSVLGLESRTMPSALAAFMQNPHALSVRQTIPETDALVPAKSDSEAAVWPLLNALKLIQKVYQV